MNKKLLNIVLAAGLSSSVLVSSCTKDLDRFPTNDVTSETVYKTANGYKQVLAKVYGAFALTGNSGPAGSGDIQGIDEGFSDFFRLFWNVQELPTDEAVIAWNDATIQNFHNMSWTATDAFLQGLYYRSIYQITVANEYLRQSADDRLNDRGITGTDADAIRASRSEVRFLRAYQYWVLMDLFGNPPFVDENFKVGTADLPAQIKRADLFNWIETELKAIESTLPAHRTNEYGRVDKGAAQALLARMYLNAQVYTGTPKWADAVTYSKRVIDAGYSLVSNYQWLLLADNHQNTNEFILTINYDGKRTQGYGGTTYLTHASTGSWSTLTGIPSGGWYGLRTTKNIVNLFPDPNGTADKRAMFYTSGQNLEINDLGTFNDGYAATRFRNVTRSGALAPNIDPNGDFTDIDMPLFRLAEMYLIYAEATLRGGGGDANLALQYVNNLRARAYGNTTGNITSAQLNTDFILDERARELYYEGHRRTDLVRYGRFTSSTYLWPWKGGVRNGTGVPDYRNLYPLPQSDVTANPNLKQNPNY